MVQNGESGLAKIREKEHKRADTFVTLTNIVSNVVSENNIFNVLLWFNLIDNCFTCKGDIEEALDVRINSSKKGLNQSTQEFEVEKLI